MSKPKRKILERNIETAHLDGLVDVSHVFPWYSGQFQNDSSELDNHCPQSPDTAEQ